MDRQLCLLDVQSVRGKPGTVQRLIIDTAHADGRGVIIYIEEEKGAAGKHLVWSYQNHPELQGFDVRAWPMSGDKITRSKPAAMAAQAGRISVMRGEWTGQFLGHTERFPSGKYDDDTDAFCGAVTQLEKLPGAPSVRLTDNSDQGWRDNEW